MQYPEEAFNELCTSSKKDIYCLPTFMIVLEFLRFLKEHGNLEVSSRELEALFLRANLTSPEFLRPIKPSAKQIERHIRKLVEKNWLTVSEQGKAVYRIEGIHLP